MPEIIDWEQLPGCGVHDGRRCLPCRDFARLVASLKTGLTVVYCASTDSWHLARTADRQLLHTFIPRQRTAA